jgi:hypothetical protein
MDRRSNAGWRQSIDANNRQEYQAERGRAIYERKGGVMKLFTETLCSR